MSFCSFIWTRKSVRNNFSSLRARERREMADISQPVDAGYGRAVKAAIAESQMAWLESGKNLERWEATGKDKLSAQERRVLMTVWVSYATICSAAH
jgi:hypothetical protein